MEHFSPPEPKISPKDSKKPIFDTKKLDSLFRTSESKIESIVFLAVLLAIAVGYFAFRPLYDSYRTDRINIANNRTEKALLEEKKVKLENLAQEITDKRDFISEVKEVLPETQQIPEALVTLEKAAADNSLFLTNFTPRENASAQGTVSGAAGVKTGAKVVPVAITYKTQEISFDLTGNYSSLRDFLVDLESNIRPFHIKTINVSGGGDGSRIVQPTLRFSVVANIYYQEGVAK